MGKGVVVVGDVGDDFVETEIVVGGGMRVERGVTSRVSSGSSAGAAHWSSVTSESVIVSGYFRK